MDYYIYHINNSGKEEVCRCCAFAPYRERKRQKPTGLCLSMS